MKYKILCQQCGSTVKDGANPICPNGHSSYDLEIDYGDVGLLKEIFLNCKQLGSNGIWRYSELMPVSPTISPITLGEGNTPLIEAKNLEIDFNIDKLFVKYEGSNPTGSFKDRCQSIAITKAVELGKNAISIASAGNAAASASAYAAKAGLSCWVFVPDKTPRERITQALLAGAHVIAVSGSVNDCSDLVEIGSKIYDWYPVTTAATKNLYQGEGPRTISFEIWEQLNCLVPDWIIAPIGGGGLLSGIAKGWRELNAFGITDKIPKLVAVQSKGCAPLINAYLLDAKENEIIRWGLCTSIASSIADPFPMDGARALRALRKHGGEAISVSDDEIIKAELLLSKREGIFVEPASATTVAALSQLVNKGKIKKNETVVLIASGSGFKDLKTAESLCGEIEHITFDEKAMNMAVDKFR